MVNPYFQQISVKKQNKFREALEFTLHWISGHREQFWTIVGTVVVTVVLVSMIAQHHQKENEEAWSQLGMPQSYLMQNKYDDARKALAQWQDRFHGTSADSYEKFLKADLLYQTSSYAEATAAYYGLAEHGMPPDVRPLALSAVETSEEMAGRYTQAQAAAQQFLSLYPDHFLAGNIMLSQARLLELTGNIPGAVSAYDRFALLYPQSPLAAIAKGRRELLAKPHP
jgi:tetratricopeptide (TPR) repeat protein